MIAEALHTTQEQQAHQKLRESLQRIVLEETQGGRRIVRSVVSIMEGDAPNCTPWHQLEAAKLLLKLGFEDAATTRIGNRPGALTPQQDSNFALTNNFHLPLGEGKGEGENPPHPVHPVSPTMSDDQLKLNKKLVRQIRVDTHDGTSMVKFLVYVVEGNEPDAKVKDRIEAAKVLLHLCFDNPAQPDPEFMMYYAPCHPDCLCVCKDLPEDHPEVARAHTLPTDEQREQWEREAEFMERVAESAEQKARAAKAWELEQLYSTTAIDDRRLEREDLRKRRELERERTHNRSP